MSRQMMVSYIMIALGIANQLGFEFPLDAIQALLNSISEDTAGLVAILAGAGGVGLRKITSTPLAQGMNGWLGKKETGELK